jgi:hypothetical protein
MSLFGSTETKIKKLLAVASGERRLGNFEAAASFEAKAEKLRSKHNLAPREPVKPEVQPRRNYYDSSDFPGVPPRQAPLTNEQLEQLRVQASGQNPDSHNARAAAQRNQARNQAHDATLRAQFGTVPEEISHFAPHAVDDRGTPYTKSTGEKQSWLSKLNFQFWD